MLRIVTIIGAVAALLATHMPAGAANFRWAADGDIQAVDPYSRQEALQLSVLGNIYEPLARWGRDMSLQPALAQSWEQTSPTVWQFHLRPGVKWQDGSPFTADDVVFSIGRILSPTSVLHTPMAAVKAVRKIDDLTVDIETNEPDPILLQQMNIFLVMSKAWCEAHDAVTPVQVDIVKEENYAVRHAMGTGAFRLVSREPDRNTVMEKNPLWWDTVAHNLDTVEFDVIGNASTRVAALISGELDMIYAVPPQDVDRISHAPGLKLWQTDELRTMYLGMDLARDELLKSNVKGKNPLKDLRVRQAFALAVDEDAIASRIMRGQAHPTWEMWGPGINGYNAAKDKRPAVDLAKARQLMAEAGYPNGFELTLDCSTDRYVNDEAICTAVAAMLARIGVKIDVNAQGKARFYGEVNTPRFRASFFLIGWTPVTYDAHNALFALLGTRNGVRGEGNDGGYSNPVLDDLIDRIGVEINPTLRTRMIDQSIDIVQHDLPDIPLHQQVILWATKSNVDLAQMPDDRFPYYDVKVK